MSAVTVYSYTQSVTYVADNILRSLKDIIRLSGLSPEKLAGEWEVLLRGISRWIETKHLDFVTLEIYDPNTGNLVKRWDIAVSYTWDADAGTFWTDTDQLRLAIKKAGLSPDQAEYRVLAQNKEGAPSVDGWSSTSFKSTAGMVRQSLGSTIEHNGLSANASYWRKV
jgi:hypothetical protein